jgi:hypothetical protein
MRNGCDKREASFRCAALAQQLTKHQRNPWLADSRSEKGRVNGGEARDSCDGSKAGGRVEERQQVFRKLATVLVLLCPLRNCEQVQMQASSTRLAGDRG